MRRIISFAAFVALLCSCEGMKLTDSEGKEEGDKNKTENTTEISVTGDAADITETSAILSAQIHIPSGINDYSAGVILNDNIEFTASSIDDTGKYTVLATGLTPNTKYFYKSFVEYGGEYHFGAVKSFKTLELNVSVSTQSASDIGLFSGTLNGHLETANASLKKEAWFIYGSNGDSDALIRNGEKVAATINDDGSFSAKLNNLQCSSTYYYIACAKVMDNEYYGDVLCFQTNDVQVSVVTGEATSIGLFSADISGALSLEDAELLSKDTWFFYGKKDSIDGLISSGTRVDASLSDDGTFVTTIHSLSYNTTYYYVACAKINGKEYYSDVIKSFSTLDIDAQVSTGSAYDISLSAATISGLLVFNHVENVSKETWFIFGLDETLDQLISNGTRVDTNLNDDGSFAATLTSLKDNTTYHYVPVVKIEDKEFVGELLSFNTKSDADYGEAVDLGLSVKWRSCNIGAMAAEEYGGYYAWGETEEKEDYTWSTYKWCLGGGTQITKYCYNPSIWAGDGDPDNKSFLDAEDDVAIVKLGNGWRMPTVQEAMELAEGCTWTAKTVNGVEGQLLTSKTNGNSIFLPYTGRKENQLLYYAGRFGWYHCSGPAGMPDAQGIHISADYGYNGAGGVGYAFGGRCIRPVID